MVGRERCLQHAEVRARVGHAHGWLQTAHQGKPPHTAVSERVPPPRAHLRGLGHEDIQLGGLHPIRERK